MSTVRTRLLQLVGLVTGLLLVGLLAAPAASAHAFLAGSDPADGAQLTTGPSSVTLTFSEAIQEGFDTVTVVGPDGNLWSGDDTSVDGATVSVGVTPLGPVGSYTIAYRVVSADSHPVSGTRTFTLTEAGTGTPGRVADTAAPGADSTGGGFPVWIVVVAAVALVGAGAALALRGGRSAPTG